MSLFAAKNFDHGSSKIVVANSRRYATKVLERLYVTLEEGFPVGCGKGHQELLSRVVQSHLETENLLPSSIKLDYRFTEIDLSIITRVEGQWQYGLPGRVLVQFRHQILNCSQRAGVSMLGHKPIKNSLCSVFLLPGSRCVLSQHFFDQRTQLLPEGLRSIDLRGVLWWVRILNVLCYGISRNSELFCNPSLALSFSQVKPAYGRPIF